MDRPQQGGPAQDSNDSSRNNKQNSFQFWLNKFMSFDHGANRCSHSDLSSVWATASTCLAPDTGHWTLDTGTLIQCSCIALKCRWPKSHLHSCRVHCSQFHAALSTCTWFMLLFVCQMCCSQFCQRAKSLKFYYARVSWSFTAATAATAATPPHFDGA